jgi:hypothetical protein
MWNRETCGSIVILLGSDQPDSSKWCDETNYGGAASSVCDS